LIRRNKYGNKKSGGFSSKLENSLHGLLLLREKAGELEDIKLQHVVLLTEAKIKYIADFSAIDTATGKRIYFESKGFKTAVWAIKKRLWAYYGPGPLEIYEGSYKNPIHVETVIPK
jgi:hypothetical protein